MTPYSETGRQAVHVAMAGFALLLPFLTWPQAAALAGAALAFNALVLARVAPTIIRPTDRRGARAGVLYYPLAVLLLVLIFPRRLDLVAAAWGVMAFGDGFATIGGRAIGGPRLPWNPDKTWSGLASFVVAGSLGALALGWWVLRWDTAGEVSSAYAHWSLALGAPVAAAMAAGLVETMPIGLDDNLSVPAIAAGVLWYIAALNWMGPVETLLLDLTVGAAVSAPVALLAWRVGGLTAGGAAAGALFAVTIYAGLYLAGLAVLATALVMTIVTSRAGRRRKAAAGEPHERRGIGNIVANCLVGTLGAALELFSFDWGLELAGAWFVAGIAAGASDTVASEIGKAWGGRPRTFPTWRAVPPGTPGAVSVAGTVAGVVSAALMTGVALALWLIPAAFVMPIVIACTAGAFLESALATRFEAGGVLDNNTLNFLNTAAAAAIAVWWCARLAS